MDVTSYTTTNATEVIPIRVSILNMHTMICARWKCMVVEKMDILETLVRCSVLLIVKKDAATYTLDIV